jgi:chromosome segregation ATPase
MSKTLTAQSGAFLTQGPSEFHSHVPSSARSNLLGNAKTPGEALERSKKTHVSLTSRLAEKNNEMDDVDSQLRAKIAQFESCLSVWKSREEALRKRQAQLQERADKYKTEQSEIEQRMVRARKKYEDATKQRDAKLKEVRDMQSLLESLRVDKRRKEEEKLRIARYQEFLNSVLEFVHGGTFNEVSDIIRRYETLKVTGQQLAARIEEDRAMIEEVKAVMTKYTQEKQTQVLIANKEIAAKNQLLEQLRLDADKEEDVVQKNREASNHTTSLLGQIKMAITNLFSRCRTRHTSSYEHSTDLIRMVEIIGGRLGDLLYVVSRAHGHGHGHGSSPKQSKGDGFRLDGRPSLADDPHQSSVVNMKRDMVSPDARELKYDD